MAALSANDSNAKNIAISEKVIERLIDDGTPYSAIGIVELKLH